MSIATELTLLANSKQAIKNSINQKGGSITDSTPFADYSTAIDNLPSGGSNADLIDLIEGDITSINIPSGTTTIKQYTFCNCEDLTSITIPNTVRVIDAYAFMNCYKLASISIPSTVEVIPQSCFENCQLLTSFSFSNNLTAIRSRAFFGAGLLSANIPSSVTTIYGQAFTACRSLNYVVVNATTPPTLYINAFDNTNNCPIYVPAESVEAYKTANNWSTYASRIVAIEDAILFTPTNGDPAISVKNYELATANYVQSSDVPSTIKNGAGSLEIGDGVTRIGMSAFQNGSSLTSVTLPSTLTRIDEVAFSGCSSLTSVTVNATTPPTLYAAAFDSTNNCPIYVPAESVDTYQAASGWSTYASRIEAIQ